MLVYLSSWRDQPVPHKRPNDGFWLPFKDETFVEVKMYGRKVFTVDHQNYVMNPEALFEWGPETWATGVAISLIAEDFNCFSLWERLG